MADEETNEAEAPETGATEAEATEEVVASADDAVEQAEVADTEPSADEPTADAGDAEPSEAPEGDGSGADAVDGSAPKRKKKRLPRSKRPQRTRRVRTPSTERKPIVRLPRPEAERGRRQERQGTVVSDAMDKTIVVEVDVIKAHRRYKKVVRRSVKFHAHDEGNTAKAGDVVRIVETRPLSATKRWRLVEIVEAAK